MEIYGRGFTLEGILSLVVMLLVYVGMIFLVVGIDKYFLDKYFPPLESHYWGGNTVRFVFLKFLVIHLGLLFFMWKTDKISWLKLILQT